MPRKNGSSGLLTLFIILAAPFLWAHAQWGWLGVFGLAACSVGAFLLWVWVLWLLERLPDRQAAAPLKQWEPSYYRPCDEPLSNETWQDRVDRLDMEAERKRQPAGEPVQKLFTPAQAWQNTAQKGWPEIERLIDSGDWDSARAALQRVAYGMVDAEADTKASFTYFMSQFALRDPFYSAVIEAALPAIERSPGIRQADMYKGIAAEKKELLRYALYFAAELGHIVRVKKGNSYSLYLPESRPLPAIAVALTIHDDRDISALLRTATAHKSDKNWRSAIECLGQAREYMLQSHVSYPAETWCKLPLYLQQAGRFDESMAEFQFLIEDLPRRARRDAQLDNPDVGSLANKQSYYESILASDLATFTEKQALATKRQAAKR